MSVLQCVCVTSRCVSLWCLLASGAVGTPLPGVEVRIVMPTTNTIIAEGDCRRSQVAPWAPLVFWRFSTGIQEPSVSIKW